MFQRHLNYFWIQAHFVENERYINSIFVWDFWIINFEILSICIRSLKSLGTYWLLRKSRWSSILGYLLNHITWWVSTEEKSEWTRNDHETRNQQHHQARDEDKATKCGNGRQNRLHMSLPLDLPQSRVQSHNGAQVLPLLLAHTFRPTLISKRWRSANMGESHFSLVTSFQNHSLHLQAAITLYQITWIYEEYTTS
jgi:hypothetical protein